MWSIWKERNHRTSNREEKPVLVVKMLLLESLYEWSRVFGANPDKSLLDFMDSLSVQL